MKDVVVPLVAAILGLVFLVAGWQRRAAAGPETAVSESPTAPANSTDPSKAAYRKVCGKCHPPYPARLHTSEEWPAFVEDMRQRASHRGMPFTEEEIEQAITYLQANGR